MNKIGRPTYLNNDKESLIVSVACIEGVHGLRLDSKKILEKLQHVIKAVKFWCGNNYIINNVTPKVLTPSHQACQQRGKQA